MNISKPQHLSHHFLVPTPLLTPFAAKLNVLFFFSPVWIWPVTLRFDLKLMVQLSLLNTSPVFFLPFSLLTSLFLLISQPVCVPTNHPGSLFQRRLCSLLCVPSPSLAYFFWWKSHLPFVVPSKIPLSGRVFWSRFSAWCCTHFLWASSESASTLKLTCM